jgi:hypothetical protein
MKTSVAIHIELHPELSIVDIGRIAERHGLRLVMGADGRYVLEPSAPLLPNGERYRNSRQTDVRVTFDRARAQNKPALTSVNVRPRK